MEEAKKLIHWIANNLLSITGYCVLIWGVIKAGWKSYKSFRLFYLKAKRWYDATTSLTLFYDRVHALESKQWVITHELVTPLYECDATGLLIDVNRSWVTLTGLERDDALGEGWARIIHKEDLDQVILDGQRFAKSGKSYEGKFRIVHAENNSVINVKATATKIYSKKGDVISIFGSLLKI